MDNINKLELLTRVLPPLQPKDTATDYSELDVFDGFGISLGLYKKNAVAVAKIVMSKGSSFRNRSHDEKEYMVVVDGELKIEIGSEIKLLTMGKCTVIPANAIHSGLALTNVEIIAVTIPAAKHFPDDGATKHMDGME